MTWGASPGDLMSLRREVFQQFFVAPDKSYMPSRFVKGQRNATITGIHLATLMKPVGEVNIGERRHPRYRSCDLASTKSRLLATGKTPQNPPVALPVSSATGKEG